MAKNIILLPTNKPTRLHTYSVDQLGLSSTALNWRFGKYIYIISDEEIPYDSNGTFGNFLCLDELEHPEDCLVSGVGDCKGCRRILLTNDPTLIAEGVQEIDDEFLKWFVNNPNCEWVELKECVINDPNNYGSGEVFHNNMKVGYEVVLPMTLVKVGDEFFLYNYKGEKLGMTGGSVGDIRLSVQNCEELFGGYNVELLFDEVDESIDYHEFDFTSFRLGFKKYKEVTKGKDYTIEDLEVVYTMAIQGHTRQEIWSRLAKERQEIEVEYVMDICGAEVYAVPEHRLTENGEVLLKRKTNE